MVRTTRNERFVSLGVTSVTNVAGKHAENPEKEYPEKESYPIDSVLPHFRSGAGERRRDSSDLCGGNPCWKITLHLGRPNKPAPAVGSNQDLHQAICNQFVKRQ